MTPPIVLLLACALVLAACRGPADTSRPNGSVSVAAAAAVAPTGGTITFSQAPSDDSKYTAELVLTGTTVRGTVKASHIVISRSEGDAAITCDVDGKVTKVTRKMRVETAHRSTLEKTVSMSADVSESNGTVTVSFTIPAFRDGRSEVVVKRTIAGGCSDETPETTERTSAPRPWPVEAREVSFSGPLKGSDTHADTTVTWSLGAAPKR